MYSTGCASSSGSYSVLVPWSGGVSGSCSGLPPRSLLSHPGTRGRSSLPSSEQRLLFVLLLVHVPPQPRPVHSWWLAPLCGMSFLCRNDCSPGFLLTHSTLVSKLFFLALQGS